MSAWPEAVWLLKELDKTLNVEEKISQLSIRIAALENRKIFIDVDPPSGSIGEGALWLHLYED